MDYASYLQTVAMLAVVVALIFGVAWLARRTGVAGGGQVAGRRRRRLAQVESLALDGKRRLVLVRRDGREHLLLVGGAADLVVERDIAPAEPAAETMPAAPAGDPRA